MAADRLEMLRKMVAARPDDPRGRFGLALEYERLGQWEEMVAELRRYLEIADDEGNAYGRLAQALVRSRGGGAGGVPPGDRGGLPARPPHYGGRVRGGAGGFVNGRGATILAAEGDPSLRRLRRLAPLDFGSGLGEFSMGC